ncbi:MAG: SDR family NAD(P)-dependent oxidoreductase [Novosphingobium sp.]|nr:SDR family NAD(P)-dependent oxidoreductase [Novosphingobium sp.]
MIGEDVLDLDGQVALVTGAGKGAGRGIALELAKHNAGGIAVNDFVAERAEEVVEEIRALGVPATAVPFDVCDLEQVGAAFAKAGSEIGAVTILVNNAGMAGPTGQISMNTNFWEEDPGEWGKYMNTNLYGVFNCTHAAIPAMVDAQRGRIVTIVSDSGRVGEPRQAVYSAAKAGAAGFMRSIAKETGRFGITANSVALASIQTMMTDDQFAEFQKSDGYKAAMSRYTIRRWGQPDDVAALVAFLCSNRASWITGQTYPLNGGYSMAQ